MRRLIVFSFILLSIVFIPALCFAAPGDYHDIGTIRYQELAGNTATVFAYLGSGGDVTIPATINPAGTDLSVVSIDAAAFGGTAITSVTIPNSVQSIGLSAFEACHSLTGVVIPASVKTIGDSAFFDCDHLLTLTLSEGLESIGESAFRGCNVLGAVTIPSTVTSVGINAFRNCAALTTVTLPDGLTTIGENMFISCDLLSSVTIPASVTSFGASAFEDCHALSSVTLTEGLTAVGSHAFHNCTALTSVTLPASLGSYPHAFLNCTLLSSVTFTDSLTIIDDDAFDGCIALTSVDIPASVDTIGIDAFLGCTALHTVTLAEGLESIGAEAFMNCSALSAVSIPSTVAAIGNEAFENCSLLANVTLQEGLVIIGTKAFLNCSALSAVNIPSTVTAIGAEAFENCTALTDVTLQEGLVTIGLDAFRDSGITAVTVPSTVTSYPGAFRACHSLTAVTLSEGLIRISADAFRNCDTLVSIVIPKSVTDIGDNSFRGSALLEKVTILTESAVFGGNSVFYATALASDGIYGFDGSTAQTYAADNTHPFHLLYKVFYDSNGGTPAYDYPDFFDYSTSGQTIAEPAEPTLDGNVFSGWYADSGLVTAWDFATSTVTGHTTLYASWTVLSLSSSDPDGSIFVYEPVTLTPSVTGGSWLWNSAYVSWDGLTPATFSALQANGATVITYTLGSETATYTLTIQSIEVPQTGQDGTWLYTLGILAVTLLGIVVTLLLMYNKYRKA